MEKVTYLAWSDIEKNCMALLKQIQRQAIEFDAVVAIQRGGCIPGVCLSHIMGISDFYTIGIRTTSSENVRSARLEKPVLSADSSLKCIKNKRVLIIDDVVNTGNTITVAKKWLWNFQPASLKSAALVWDGSYNNVDCPVDFHALYTLDWVVFPWENISSN